MYEVGGYLYVAYDCLPMLSPRSKGVVMKFRSEYSSPSNVDAEAIQNIQAGLNYLDQDNTEALDEASINALETKNEIKDALLKDISEQHKALKSKVDVSFEDVAKIEHAMPS